LDKISYVSEIRFEDGILNDLFKTGKTESDRRLVIDKEIDEKDG
jgi:hypothetical protein